MARRIIDIGDYSNDGTGDNIRDAFDKVNENFRDLFGVIGDGDSVKFSNLSDAPASYETGQVISAISASQLAAKNLVAGSNISIVNSPTDITIEATVPSQPSPTSLTNPLNTDRFVIAKAVQPDDIDATTQVQAWNTDYNGLTGITLTVDDLLISKSYADNRYVVADANSPIPVRDTPNIADAMKIITGYNSGNVVIGAGHNLTNANDGDEYKFNSTGVIPSPLVNGASYYISVVNATTLELYSDPALTLLSRVLVDPPVSPGIDDVVCLYIPEFDIQLSGTWNANEAVPRAATVLRDGDTMLGDLVLPGVTSVPNGAITRGYVDALTTDDIAEGATSKYYSSVLATQDAKDAISTTNTGTGYGALSYLDGVVTFSKVTDANIRSAFTAGVGIDITGGTISVTSLMTPINEQARHAISVASSTGLGSLTYDVDSGQFVYLGPTESLLRSKFSASSAVGTRGSLRYSSRTGQFSYTGVTDQEIRGCFSAGAGITISAGGVIASSITQYSNSDARAAISVYASTGNGALTYDNSTGRFTYAGPSDSVIRSKFSAGTGVNIDSNGVIGIGQAVSPDQAVQFFKVTTPTVDAGSITASGTITGNVIGNLTGTASHLANLNDFTTNHLLEGNANLYFTNNRVYDYLQANLVQGDGSIITFNNTTKKITVAFAPSALELTTLDVVENPARLYFTDDRARTATFSAISFDYVTDTDGTGAGNLTFDTVSNKFVFSRVTRTDIANLYSSYTKPLDLTTKIKGLFCYGVTSYDLTASPTITTALVLSSPTGSTNPIQTNVIRITKLSANSTISLPAAGSMAGISVTIINLTDTSHKLTILDVARPVGILLPFGTGAGSLAGGDGTGAPVDGRTASGTLDQGQVGTFISDGQNWLLVTGGMLP